MSDSTADRKVTTPGRPDEGGSKEAKAHPVVLLVDDDGATLALVATSLSGFLDLLPVHRSRYRESDPHSLRN